MNIPKGCRARKPLLPSLEGLSLGFRKGKDASLVASGFPVPTSGLTGPPEENKQSEGPMSSQQG